MISALRGFSKMLLLLISPFISVADCAAETGAHKGPIAWNQIEPGYEIARYDVTAANALIRSQVVLARFDPKHFAIKATFAPDSGSQRSDIQSMIRETGGVAGINANYFDVNGDALGLVISDSIERNRLHRGGRALTGLFLEDETGRFRILQRTELGSLKPRLAVQSGPRLVVKRTAVEVDSVDSSNRRSGVAVTADNRVIFFATMTRFPGATFRDLQNMLLRPELNVVDALNFDGGGSSQMFLSKGDEDGADLVVSGGDLVPVAVVAVRRSPMRAERQ